MENEEHTQLHLWQQLASVRQQMKIFPLVECAVFTRGSLDQGGVVSYPLLSSAGGYVTNFHSRRLRESDIASPWLSSRVERTKIPKIPHEGKSLGCK